MSDMITRLYNMPDPEKILEELKSKGIIVKRAIGPEKMFLESWCRANFTVHAAGEVSVGMSRLPSGVFVAVKNNMPVGYACYDATARGFFGPTGVLKEYRGIGIGKALLYCTLKAMREEGYAYAVIGSAGPKEFYVKNCGAIEIPDSTPGIYENLIRNIE